MEFSYELEIYLAEFALAESLASHSSSLQTNSYDTHYFFGWRVSHRKKDRLEILESWTLP